MVQASPIINWQLLRAFLALASTKSSDLAAGQLGISVTTLKRRLARLEDVVGEKLSRGYMQNFSLTARGERLALTLSQMDDILGQIKPELVQPQRVDRLPTSIWMMDVLFELFLMPFLQQTSDIAGAYEIQVTSGAMPEISQRFTNEITLAHYSSDSAHAHSVLVGVHQVGFGATSAYMKRFGVPDLNNLADHHLAFVSDYRLIRGLWVGLEDILVKCATTIETDSTAACHVLAKEGAQFTLITQWSTPELYERCPRLPVAELPVYLSFNKSFYRDARGKALTDRMIEEAKTFFCPNPDWIQHVQ